MASIIYVTLRKQRQLYVNFNDLHTAQQPKLKTAFDSSTASTFTASFFLFGDDAKIMWRLSDGIKLVTSELAIRSYDCVFVTHPVPQKLISCWSHLALFSWSQHIANQHRHMQDWGVEIDTACDKFLTLGVSWSAKTRISNWMVSDHCTVHQCYVQWGPQQGQYTVFAACCGWWRSLQIFVFVFVTASTLTMDLNTVIDKLEENPNIKCLCNVFDCHRPTKRVGWTLLPKKC